MVYIQILCWQIQAMPGLWILYSHSQHKQGRRVTWEMEHRGFPTFNCISIAHVVGIVYIASTSFVWFMIESMLSHTVRPAYLLLIVIPAESEAQQVSLANHACIQSIRKGLQVYTDP